MRLNETVNKTETFSVSLRIQSEALSITEISSAVDLKPTSSLEKGARLSPRSATSAISTVSNWIFKGDKSEADLDEQASALFERLAAQAPAIKRLSDLGCDVSLSVGLNLSGQSPGIELSKPNIEKLASLGARVWVDTYLSESYTRGEDGGDSTNA